MSAENNDSCASSMTASSGQLIFCMIGLLVSPLYIALTLVAILSAFIPFLKVMASHGKTRMMIPSLSSSLLPPSSKKEDNNNNKKKVVKQQGGEEEEPTTTPTRLPGARTTTTTTNSVYLSYYWWDKFLHDEEMFYVNKRYFLHFYFVGLVSLIGFVLITTTTTTTSSSSSSSSSLDDKITSLAVAVFLMGIHLIRRCYECLFIHQYSTKSKMHISGYICGIVHYLFLPFMVFHVGGGCDDDETTNRNLIVPTKSSLMMMINIIGGTLLCLIGQWEQYQHHKILSSLRTTSSDSTTTTSRSMMMMMKESKYKIPIGRGFQYVSCPHYLAEIIIYISFAIILFQQEQQQQQHGQGESSGMNQSFSSTNVCNGGGNGNGMIMIMNQLERVLGRGKIFFPPSLQHYVFEILIALRRYRHAVLVIWVMTNLTITAIRCHQWYIDTFPVYPSLKRKAIFPLIF